jgi:hypothetical protein
MLSRPAQIRSNKSAAKHFAHYQNHKESNVIEPLRTVLAYGALALCCASGLAQAQVGPMPQPPESYGAPDQPQLPSTNQASERAIIGFSFNLEVAVAEVQAIVPAGYTALPTVSGGTTTNVMCDLWLQNQLWAPNAAGSFARGSYGPFNSFGCYVYAMPPPDQQNALGFEVFQFVRYVNNAAINDLRNAMGGAGSTRFANIDARLVTTTGGEMRMKVSVDDPDSNFKLQATLKTLPVIDQQLRRAGPVVVRFVDMTSSPMVTRSSFDAFIAVDSASITEPGALDVAAKKLKLAAGTLTILSVTPASVAYGPEVFLNPRS